jgi:hypothetical protein
VDTLPLRAELALALRGFLAAKAPTAPAFHMPDRQRVIDMFRADLDAAGIPCAVEGPNGPLYADFHSLRHSFITMLAAGGVHPKVAQAQARHSTITLTMDRYTHTVMSEQSAGLAALPDFSRPARQRVRTTGTDNAPTAPPRLARYLAPRQRCQVETSGGADGLSGEPEAQTEEWNNPADSAGLCGEIKRRGRDSNPRYPYGHTGFRDRPNQPLWHLSSGLFHTARAGADAQIRLRIRLSGRPASGGGILPTPRGHG